MSAVIACGRLCAPGYCLGDIDKLSRWLLNRPAC